MKKLLLIGGIFTAGVIFTLLVVGVIGYARAQSGAPGRGYGPGNGYGMMNGRGMMGGWGRQNAAGTAVPGANQGQGNGYGYGYGMMGGRGMMGGYGPMQQYMVDALAKELNLKPEDLQARFNQGETPYQIAQSQGLSDQQITDLMNKVHDEMLKSAVASGALTQEQADWMDQHHDQMWQNGFGGHCFGGRTVQPTAAPNQ